MVFDQFRSPGILGGEQNPPDATQSGIEKQGQSTIWLSSCPYVSQEIQVNVVALWVWSCYLLQAIFEGMCTPVQVTEVVIYMIWIWNNDSYNAYSVMNRTLCT